MGVEDIGLEDGMQLQEGKNPAGGFQAGRSLHIQPERAAGGRGQMRVVQGAQGGGLDGIVSGAMSPQTERGTKDPWPQAQGVPGAIPAVSDIFSKLRPGHAHSAAVVGFAAVTLMVTRLLCKLGYSSAN
jgi:hypothetical protein